MTSYNDDKGLTHHGHLNEKLINKLENVFGIGLEQR